MKKHLIVAMIAILLVLSITLAACGNTNNNTNKGGATDIQGGSSTDASSGTYTAAEPTQAEDAEDNKTEIAGDFAIVTEGDLAAFSVENNVYTIQAAGTYTLSGNLQGRIVVNAGDDDEVTLELDGVSITCDDNSPIYCINADKLIVKALEGTYNEITDNRSVKTQDEDGQGAGAIYAQCDLNLSGKGSLVVTASYNNGVHTKDDLKIKNVTLKVTAPNNALKGNDSVTVESGQLILVATDGDGIKTENSDVSNKGNQRGTITISGGVININCAYDGIDAAYDVVIEGSADISVKTATYADLSGAASTKPTSVSASTESTKGIKADNAVSISGGNVVIASYDDAIHANGDVTLENGNVGAGDVNVSDGTLSLTTKDDGIHADGTLSISGGNITVATSLEGLEGHVVSISGGEHKVYATDDGINASGDGTALVEISGGYITVRTPSGDTDAIDSNGSYVQTGGFVVVLGGSSQGGMSGSVDIGTEDGGYVRITGGTILAFGGISVLPDAKSCNYVSFGSAFGMGGRQGEMGGMVGRQGGNMGISGGIGGRQGGMGMGGNASYTFASGTWTVKDSSGNTLFEVTLPATYANLWICSEQFAQGNTYTLANGSATYTWSQSAQSGTIQ